LALSYELRKSNLEVKNQVGFPMVYDEIKFDIGFRIDILVDNLVIIEVKSVESLMDVHYKQLLTNLKLMDKRLGILINFNTSLITKQIIRIANNL
jgi:GxxExxY protein